MHKGNNNSGIFASFVIVKTQIVNKMMSNKLLLQALCTFFVHDALHPPYGGSH